MITWRDIVGQYETIDVVASEGAQFRSGYFPGRILYSDDKK